MKINVFFDFDSTICQVESLDYAIHKSLHNHPNRGALSQQVKSITDQAMSGDIDLQESIALRLAIVPLSRALLVDLSAELATLVTPGMVELVTQLVQQRHQVHVISGGFDELIADTVALLEIPPEQSYANQFVYQQNQVIGFNTANPLTTTQGKAQVIAAVKNPDLPTVMIGDGYNDLSVYLQQACEHFIGFGQNARRSQVEHAAPHYALTTQQLSQTLSQLY